MDEFFDAGMATLRNLFDIKPEDRIPLSEEKVRKFFEDELLVMRVGIRFGASVGVEQAIKNFVNKLNFEPPK
jgi:hypothetical protein